jgi:hypothetical protein
VGIAHQTLARYLKDVPRPPHESGNYKASAIPSFVAVSQFSLIPIILLIALQT